MKIYILCYSSEEYGNGEPEVFKTYIDAENALIKHYNEDVNGDFGLVGDHELDLNKGWAYININESNTEYQIYGKDI